MAIFAVLAMAFVAAQSLGAIHAAKYGDGPHEHGGAACIISVLTKGGEKFVATSVVALAAFFASWRVIVEVARNEPAPATVRAARPRGPPTH